MELCVYIYIYIYVCVTEFKQGDIAIAKRSDTAVHFAPWGHGVKLGYDCLGACCSGSRQYSFKALINGVKITLQWNTQSVKWQSASWYLPQSLRERNAAFSREKPAEQLCASTTWKCSGVWNEATETPEMTCVEGFVAPDVLLFLPSAHTHECHYDTFLVHFERQKHWNDLQRNHLRLI